MPYAFQKLPRSLKDYYLQGKGKNGPAGSHWLIPRLKNVTMHKEQNISEVKQVNNHIAIKLSNSLSIDADHVILATGYRAHINRLSMLHPDIRTNVKIYKGSPILNNYF